jgi:hypothetical protein
MNSDGIKVVHAIPGRVRLKVAEVKENPALAKEVQERLTVVQGIHRVEVSPLTGSVLVFYEAQETTSPDSLRALAESLAVLFPRLTVQDLEAWQTPSTTGADATPALTTGLPTFFGTLNARVDTVTGGSADLKILLPLTLFVLGLRGLFISEKLLIPTWYDLLWFSLGTYFMLNPKRHRGILGTLDAIGTASRDLLAKEKVPEEDQRELIKRIFEGVGGGSDAKFRPGRRGRGRHVRPLERPQPPGVFTAGARLPELLKRAPRAGSPAPHRDGPPRP